MKATLTIEVPDDFKKGECSRCPVTMDGASCGWLSSNCPLEIQEKTEYPKSCNGCGHYEQEHTSGYCHKCLDSRVKENNQ